MSNISNIIQFLKGKPERFITITNQENGNSIGKNNIYLTDIPNEDLQHYIKFSVGNITAPTLLWIEMRTKQGTTSKKENVCKIEVSPDNYAEPETVMPLQAAVQQQAQVMAQQPFLAAPNLGNNIFGLSMPEIMGMQRKSDLLEDKKEQLSELKVEYKQLKQNYDLLEIDHRKAISDLAVAESKKEMAVMLAKLENKSFADSPVFQSLIDNAPAMLQGIAAMKQGAVPAAGMGLSSPGVSDTHTQFIEFMNDNLNENQVNFLGSICSHMNNETFKTQIHALVQQYATS
jgi:hypothetical protein